MSRKRALHVVSIAWLLAAVWSRDAYAAIAPQADLQLRQALSVLECLRYSTDLSLLQPFPVQGVQVARNEVVAASEISFADGATLIFPRSQNIKRSSGDCENVFYIVADTIRNTSAEPAIITWEKSQPYTGGFNRGQAPAGASGVAPGESGLEGSQGSAGNAGVDGDHGPNLVLLVESITGKIKLDFRGQDGSDGGVGQTGGNGGAGAQGSSAVTSLFDCKRGPGKGGDGGNGGAGGRGGRGGNGGVGGTVIVITPRQHAPAARQLLEVAGEGGLPGKGGVAGAGGGGGSEGRGGLSRLPCQGTGDNGAGGLSGPNGVPGPQGFPGEDGDFYLLALPTEEFAKVKQIALGVSKR